MVSICYHHVTEDPGPDPMLSVGRREFETQMEIIASAQDWVRPVSAVEFHRLWTGQAPGDGRVPLLITFDDGYRDNLTCAAPILRRHGHPAILFVATDVLEQKPLWYDVIGSVIARGGIGELRRALGWMENAPAAGVAPDIGGWVAAIKELEGAPARRAVETVVALARAGEFDGAYLSAKELRSWAEQGFEIGCHTRSHPRLSRLPREEVAAELRESRAILAGVCGCEIQCFAYPFGKRGDFTAETEEEVRSQGFAMAFSLVKGSNVAGDWPYVVRRNPIWNGSGRAPHSGISLTAFLGDLMGVVPDLRRTIPWTR